MKNIVLLFVAVVCCASAIIWMKLSTVDYALLAAARCLLAALVLAPLALRDLRRHRVAPWPLLRRTLWPGIFLGCHFVLWIYGARLTLTADASIIANMSPLAMPFFLYFMAREAPNRRELSGTGIAMIGLILLGVSSADLSVTYLRGNIFCFLAMIALTGYLALGRANRDFPTIWTYVTPVYVVAGVVALASALPRLGHLTAVSAPGREGLLIVALVFLPTIFGHSLVNFAMRRLRGQTVAVVMLSQFIFSTVFAYFTPGVRETPLRSFYGAAILICLGVGIVLRRPPK